jgi:AmmeMemoRadiSam system protein A
VDAVGEITPSGPFKDLTGEERKILLQLARSSLEGFFRQTVPSLSLAGYPALNERRGCFVTLFRKDGSLRGCVGNVVPRLPLALAIIENARSAAFSDSRFAPVERSELRGITIEISVLTRLTRLQWSSVEELLRQVRPCLDGVILEVSGRVSTYLPQVWEKLPAPVDFMNSLAMKSGLPADSWRNPSSVISIYQAESFME